MNTYIESYEDESKKIVFFTMSQLYRICITGYKNETKPDPEGLLNEEFVTKAIPRCPGPLFDICDPLLSMIFDGSFNYSFIQGDKQRENICQNSLHDNTSDIMIYPADLPVNDDLIDIYAVIGQSKLEFMSSYYYRDEGKNADVLDSVMSFKFSLWMLILFLIFLFASLIKSKKSRSCPEYLMNFMDRLDQVFAHFIGQNSIDGDGLGLKSFIITLTFFSLMMNQYYNALIHTDLVVPVEPDIPYCYDDFASKVSLIRFPNETSALKYFIESPEGYPERRLYNEALRRNVTIGDGKPGKPDWVTGDAESWLYYALYSLENRHVTISSGVHMTTLVSMICSAKVYAASPDVAYFVQRQEDEFIPRFKNLYPWVSSDPETRTILHAFVKRKDFIPEKKVWKRVKRSIEHGMFQKLILAAEAMDLSQALDQALNLIKVKPRPTAMRDCHEYTRIPKIKEVEFQALKVVNFEKFTLVFHAFISVCCMAFIVEVATKERLPLVHPI